jgi:hypothetical protein
MQQPQQVPGSQARPTMSTVPKVVTTKDCAYLKDEMSWLLLAMKKCAHFASECQDPAIQQAINQIGQMHERQYTLLLKHLQTNNAQVMSNVPQPNQMQ